MIEDNREKLHEVKGIFSKILSDPREQPTWEAVLFLRPYITEDQQEATILCVILYSLLEGPATQWQGGTTFTGDRHRFNAMKALDLIGHADVLDMVRLSGAHVPEMET